MEIKVALPRLGLMAIMGTFGTAFPVWADCGPREPSRQWFDCSTDADCVLSHAICGDVIGINARYADEQEQYARCMGPMVSCAVPDRVTGAKAICKDGHCQLDGSEQRQRME